MLDRIFTTDNINALVSDKGLNKDFWKQNSLLCDIADMKIDNLLEKYSLTCSIDAYRTWQAHPRKLRGMHLLHSLPKSASIP